MPNELWRADISIFTLKAPYCFPPMMYQPVHFFNLIHLCYARKCILIHTCTHRTESKKIYENCGNIYAHTHIISVKFNQITSNFFTS